MAGFKIADTRSTVLYHPRRVADMVHRHRTREMSSLLRDGAVYYKQIRKSERKPTRLQNSSRTTGHWRTRGTGNFSPMRRLERPSGEREAVESHQTKPGCG